MTVPQKIWTDNALEDYFLDLLVKKHVIDREIQDLLHIIEKSKIHPDYQLLLKKVLFGSKNVYIENWGTLQSSLEDIIKSIDIRGNDIVDYGIVLRLMIRVVEEIFNIDDTYLHEFLLSEEKEDIEHRLIILMKRILDYIESGLKDILSHSEHLDEPIGDHLKDEYLIIKSTLEKYPWEIMESQKKNIASLKIGSDTLLMKIKSKKTNLRHISV